MAEPESRWNWVESRDARSRTRLVDERSGGEFSSPNFRPAAIIKIAQTTRLRYKEVAGRVCTTGRVTTLNPSGILAESLPVWQTIFIREAMCLPS